MEKEDYKNLSIKELLELISTDDWAMAEAVERLESANYALFSKEREAVGFRIFCGHKDIDKAKENYRILKDGILQTLKHCVHRWDIWKNTIEKIISIEAA